jgi:hypothetical protein
MNYFLSLGYKILAMLPSLINLTLLRWERQSASLHNLITGTYRFIPTSLDVEIPIRRIFGAKAVRCPNTVFRAVCCAYSALTTQTL